MKKVLAIVLIVSTQIINAQVTSRDSLEKFGRVNVGLHGLEASYELPVSKKMVWENTVGIGMGSNVYGSSVEYYFDFKRPIPFLKSELKYIYNFEKRVAKGKRTINNSGNYIGLQTKYSFGDRVDRHLDSTLLTEVHWGIQRSLGGGFLFNVQVGLGYLSDFDTTDGSFTPTAGIKFGYRLF